ncbi:MAG: molybdopterin molybdotransferase MoeA, partial [Oerskovia sp.]|nr:molybdopterin molybdotransferase MoeA [Oerskovia sp.]
MTAEQAAPSGEARSGPTPPPTAAPTAPGAQHQHAAGAGRVSVEQHRREVEALLGPALADRRVEHVALVDALDRVLAADLLAPVDLPAFRSSQMDGYAVRSTDVAGASSGSPVVLPVVAEIPAGPGTPAVLSPGTAARIMTGAVVPEGSDAVVPVEDTDAVRFGAHAT